MRKLWFILKKELLLLVRDVPGLIVLFLMPVLLIFVVTLAQENALKLRHAETKLLYADESNSEFSAQLLAELDSSGFFKPVPRIGSSLVTVEQAKELIASGAYSFGICLSHPDSAVVILIDPTLQESYQKSVANSLIFIIKGKQTKDAMNSIIGNLPENIQPVIRSVVSEKMNTLPQIVTSYAHREKSDIQPNVIQNNVPGFILFAMFFIVIPLAGSMITEKTEGSFQRLRSLPVGMTSVLGGKVIAYLLVCLLQFVLMMFIGAWVFPTFFGFPSLDFGHAYFAIAVATIAAAMAAIGFGIIVGAIATTHNQAALFGSVMVVLLGIVSGTFLPIHVMPKAIQFFSHLSPIRWGIDNYLNLFIREGGIISILPNTLLLILFFGLAMIASIVIFAKRIS